MNRTIDINKYAFIKRLGQGAYGSVAKVRELETGRVVAVKQIALKGDVDSQLRVFREVQCLRHCEHDNIVKLLDVILPSLNMDSASSTSSVFLVLSYAESTLRLVIDDFRRPLMELIPRHYFRQILYGVAYLHQIGIMHRDLKPDNILVTAQNMVRITDFGLARIYFPDYPDKVYEHQVATRWYRAPELLFGATKYAPTVDIWALGCIFAEFFNGEPLFAGKTDIEQLARVFELMGTPTDQSWPGWETLPDAGKVMFDNVEPVEDWTNIVSLASSESLRLVRSLLQLNPAQRPTALRCLEQPFFAEHLQYDEIPYRPPALEEQIERREPEIIFAGETLDQKEEKFDESD